MKIPEGWRWATVSDYIEDFDAGVSVNGEDQPASPSEFGVLKVSCVTEGVFRQNENKRISGIELDRARTTPKADRILMSRANSPELVGASAYIKDDYPYLFLSDKLWQMRPIESGLTDMRWLQMVLSSPAYRRKLSSMATGTSMSMKNISKESVLGLSLLAPQPDEQRTIADTLSTWDTAIEKMERLIAAKEMLLAMARERAFQKSENSMRVRVGDVTRESDARNNGRLDRDKVMAVTKSVGMRPMREETIASSLDRYKIVRPGGFAYNPMRLNIGSIAKSGFESNVLVSPDYVVFECLESRMLPGLLEHLRHARRWSTYFEAAGSGGVRVRIHYDELARFEFWHPDLRQQASVLGRLDLVTKEIRLLKDQLALLQRQKRGLMQKLLAGAWRVPVPKGTP